MLIKFLFGKDSVVKFGHDLPDHDSHKPFLLYSDVDSIEFGEQGTEHEQVAYLNYANVQVPDSKPHSYRTGLTVPVTGPVYVMNDEGKTLQVFTPKGM